MNAELLESNIVIRFTTNQSGTRMYTAKKIRKNLTPTSFIGAIAATEDGLQAYSISSAKLYSYQQGVVIRVKAGPYNLPYMPISGVFGATPLS